jgi:hypothetical protein
MPTWPVALVFSMISVDVMFSGFCAFDVVPACWAMFCPVVAISLMWFVGWGHAYVSQNLWMCYPCFVGYPVLGYPGCIPVFYG